MSLAVRNDKVLQPFIRRGIQITSQHTNQTYPQHQYQHHQLHTIRNNHHLLHSKRPQPTLQSVPETSSEITKTTSSPKNTREFHHTTHARNPISSIGGGGGGGSGLGTFPPSYFQRPSLPANTVIRFVPQQTAWIVERMGQFSRILEPGLAILVPFIDRIAYVKSLKEIAIEIPSQSAITADNVTLELDGVLYTRVFDAYKARYFCPSSLLPSLPTSQYIITYLVTDLHPPSTATASRMPNTPSLS